jgi:hypothetical protein
MSSGSTWVANCSVIDRLRGSVEVVVVEAGLVVVVLVVVVVAVEAVVVVGVAVVVVVDAVTVCSTTAGAPRA